MTSGIRMARSLLLDAERASSEAVPAAAVEAPQAVAARLFAAHARFVARGLARLGVAEHDVQDACQEVFLTAFRRQGAFRGESRETTWLYGICLRVAANYRRKRQRRREELRAEVTHADAAQPPEAAIDVRRLANQLDAALERLSEKKREVFVLFEFAEREMEEVAEIVGVPLKTCYSRLYAARSELQADLARQRGGDGKS